MDEQNNRARNIVGEPPVFKSTEGDEQEIFEKCTMLVKAIENSAQPWHELLDDAMRLKDRAKKIGERLFKRQGA